MNLWNRLLSFPFNHVRIVDFENFSVRNVNIPNFLVFCVDIVVESAIYVRIDGIIVAVNLELLPLHKNLHLVILLKELLYLFITLAMILILC